MIRLDNISKQNGHQLLFIDASMGLMKGEKVGLVGPNGAGKSTLFRMIAGQDKPFIGALVWPSMAGMQSLAAEGNPLEKLTEILTAKLKAFNADAGGGSRRIGRLIIMTEPPSIDAGEITDKGYVNQRATLERRAALVDGLYANPPAPGVIVL